MIYLGLLWTGTESASGQQASNSRSTNQTTNTERPQMSAKELFAKLAGDWQGVCRTWFDPRILADESNVRGHFEAILASRFLRHTYQATLQGKPRQGEELIAFNTVTGKYQTTWVDDFHMNYAIMMSEGEQSDGGFTVVGAYDTAPNQPRWGWKTVWVLTDDDHLTITAYNVDPQGTEFKAVVTEYRRVSR